ncbi:PLL family lectin [Streptomyces sennicomposti]
MTVWGTWERLGGSSLPQPAAVSVVGDRLDVFTPAADSTVRHGWGSGSKWDGWEDLGGDFISAPEAGAGGRTGWTSSPSARTALCVTSGSNGARWGAWENLAGEPHSKPVAVCWAAHRLDIFARGKGSTLQHLW